MEIAKAEVTAIEQVIEEKEDGFNDLNDFQLAMVGGGIGEVILG